MVDVSIYQKLISRVIFVPMVRHSHCPYGFFKVVSLELHLQPDSSDVSEVTGVFRVPEASQNSSNLTLVERDTATPLTRHLDGHEGVRYEDPRICPTLNSSDGSLEHSEKCRNLFVPSFLVYSLLPILPAHTHTHVAAFSPLASSSPSPSPSSSPSSAAVTLTRRHHRLAYLQPWRICRESASQACSR